jgi:pimeloyl-CoA dehydrogenase
MLPIAEEDGGLGGSAVDVMAIMEGIGRHLIPTSYVANAVLVPALVSGDPAAAGLLAAIGEGSAKAAAGLLEPDGGYDLGWVECAAATGHGAEWTLVGEKLHVEDGADADWFVVTAKTEAGISLFLVSADAPGLTVSRFRAIDQHRHARLKLDGVPAVLIGEAGAALPRVELAVDKAICAHLAEAVGSMEAAHGATLEYLRTRKQFGVAIGSFQSLQHRAVDMAIALEEARSMSYRATLSLGLPAAERRRVVSAAKARVGQCGLYIGRQAVQLHGGVGFSDELIISHHLKRQMMLDFAYGSAEHHVALVVAAA